jgi:hypothetical protein
MEMFAPDVVAIADGGGVVPALRKPITGSEKLTALLARFAEAPGFGRPSPGSTGCQASDSTSMAQPRQ